MDSRRLIFGIVSLMVLTPVAHPAQEKTSDDQYVSRQEHEKLKGDYEKLKQEMEQIKSQMQALLKREAPAQVPPPAPPSAAPPAAPPVATQQAVEELKKELRTVKSQAEATKPGTTKFLLTGYAAAGYADRGSGKSSFNALFAPIFLWKLGDRVFFEGEPVFELEEDETKVDLEYAHITYLLNNYVTLGAGKFLNPSNYFIERLHPAWINKLPDFPLPFVGETAIQAESQLGFQLRGGVPIGPTRLGYAFYVSNGPKLRDSGEDAGTLDFDNFEDINNDKAVGGRIGFVPIPYLELGYGFEVAGVHGNGLSSVDAVTHSVDANYARSISWLRGNVDFRAQYVWLEIDNPGVDQLNFRNQRDGGYAQIAYRPSLAAVPILKDLEGVFRYDWLNLPANAPLNADEQRWTLGLNYWFTPSTALKAAYEFDDRKGAIDDNAFLMQFATGF
ncbi:hypothetical protein EVC37_18765 [Methylocaldum sp. BRCS4]|jgi:hypothetical protein|nr:hypothetical protein [Methylocaldum sp. BRCS4]